MRVAFFSDAHIGAPGWSAGYPYLYSAVRREREAGSQIVWLGDTLDYWRVPNPPVPDIFAPGDIYIPGNHDWFVPSPPCEGMQLASRFQDGPLYAGHGDEVDMHYAFALLERGEGPSWVRALSKIKKWKRDHVYSFYALVDNLPNWIVEAFEHGSRVSKFRAFSTVILLVPFLLLSSTNVYHPEPPSLPPPDPRGGFGGLNTKDPAQLLERYLALVPSAREARIIVIGHLHQPMAQQVGDKWIVVLGAWTSWDVRTGRAVYGVYTPGKFELVDKEGNTVKVINLEGV